MINNFTEYFRVERDVYVQNVSSCQVSVGFEIGPGNNAGWLFPNSKDPVNITRHIPFHAVKGSMDFRKMLNRSPATLRLLTEAEYMEYFERQAKSNGLTVDQAIDKAEERRMSVQDHKPLPDAVAPKKKEEQDEEKQVVSEEEVINSRVLHLCLQVHPSLPEQSKMTAQAMLSELDVLDSLTIQDWEYIQAHGYYKSVQKLAKKKVAELAAAAVLESEPKQKKKSASADSE